MILNELVLRNFGIYSGEHSIQLAPPTPQKPIILFAGLNGRGKTTVLDAVQLALFGKRAVCSNRGILAYEEYLQRCVHRNCPPESEAGVELQFSIRIEGKPRAYRIQRSWKMKGDSISFRTEAFCDGEFDRVLTDLWDEQVEEFVPAKIAGLFFFDGDKIEAFADIDHSSEILATAIHSLLGLDLVDRLCTDLVVLERRKHATKQGESDREGVRNAENNLNALKARRKDLVESRASCQNDLDRREKILRAVDTRFRSEGGNLYEQRDVIRVQLEALARRLQESLARLIDHASGVLPLLLIRPLLHAVDDQVKKETLAAESANTGALLEARDTAFMRFAAGVVRPDAAASIATYLKRDRAARLLSRCEEIYQHLGDGGREQLSLLLSVRLDEMLAVAKKGIEEVAIQKKELDEFERKQAAMPDSEIIADIVKEQQAARSAVVEASARLTLLDEELRRLEQEYVRVLSTLQSKFEQAVSADFEREDASRVVTYSQRVRQSLNDFRGKVLVRHVQRIEHLILDCFKQLLRKESLLGALRIDVQRFKLRLEDRDGRELHPDRLSAGERQLLAVSILWGLARASGRPLPAIIDTPLGRLDSFHRTHLVERYFPYASHQVLLLSTDKEIDREYFEKLKPWVGRSYHLKFDDKSGSTSIDEGYFW